MMTLTRIIMVIMVIMVIVITLTCRIMERSSIPSAA